MTDKSQLDRAKVAKFAQQILVDLGAAFQGGLNYIGDRLGIFKAMAGAGALSPAALARRTGLNERYLREWLGAMVAAGYVEYAPAEGTYLLPEEHAMVLANEGSAFFMGGFFEQIVPAVSMAPRVAEAFKHGGGVPQSAYSPEFFEGGERCSAAMYDHQLLRKWLPAMPQVIRALEDGGSALDVGCGGGRACIALAKAFSKAQVHGYDSHADSIERARANAKVQGLDHRIVFAVVDCTRLPPQAFDFISTFNVVHDSIDPLGLLRSIRQALKPGGTYLMQEMNVSSRVEDNLTPIGRMFYSISTLYCATVSLAEGGVGIGALMGEERARELAHDAGFTSVRRLPIQDPFSALMELRG